METVEKTSRAQKVCTPTHRLEAVLLQHDNIPELKLCLVEEQKTTTKTAPEKLATQQALRLERNREVRRCTAVYTDVIDSGYLGELKTVIEKGFN